MQKTHLKGATLKFGTGIGAITFKIHTGELPTRTPGVMVADTGSQGAREYLLGGGLDEFDLNCEAWLDMENPPNAMTPQIKTGNIVPFTLALKTGFEFAGSVYIEECTFALGTVDGTDAVNCQLSTLGTGPLTFPTALTP